MKVAIIDCGAGNLHSVRKAFAHELPLFGELNVVTDAAELADATHIVLPGVGAFADCMQGLDKLPGMRAALEKKVLNGTTPFLGICVGMQMLFTHGHEHGKHSGLGWFKGEVMPLVPADAALRIPHMGWNGLKLKRPHAFLSDINEGDAVYFVHSYAVQHQDADILMSTVDYGGEVVSVVGRKNVVGTQFHPEKSQRVGLRLIANFLKMM